jgi:hypothetical protein
MTGEDHGKAGKNTKIIKSDEDVSRKGFISY